MKLRLPGPLMLIVVSLFVSGQDNNWPSLSYLKSDFRRVSIVAHVRINEAEIVNRVGGYEDWHLVGEVIEPFKGKFHKTDRIEFYHGAEAGFRKETFLGEKIVFLERNFVEKEKRWVLAVLENSTLPYTLDRVQKLRRIRSSMKKGPPSRKGVQARGGGCLDLEMQPSTATLTESDGPMSSLGRKRIAEQPA